MFYTSFAPDRLITWERPIFRTTWPRSGWCSSWTSTLHRSPLVDGRSLSSQASSTTSRRSRLFFIVSHWLFDNICLKLLLLPRFSITCWWIAASYLTIKRCRAEGPAVTFYTLFYDYCFKDLHYNFYKVISSSIFYTGLTYYEAFLQLLRGDYGNVSNRVVEPVELVFPPHYKALLHRSH